MTAVDATYVYEPQDVEHLLDAAAACRGRLHLALDAARQREAAAVARLADARQHEHRLGAMVMEAQAELAACEHRARAEAAEILERGDEEARMLIIRAHAVAMTGEVPLLVLEPAEPVLDLMDVTNLTIVVQDAFMASLRSALEEDRRVDSLAEAS